MRMSKRKKWILVAVGMAVALFTTNVWAACTLISESTPDANGNYTQVWLCDGKQVTYTCTRMHCGVVDDDREQQ